MKRNLLFRFLSRKAILLFLSLFLLNCVAFSQTKFYLNTNTAASLSPAFNAGWNVTTGASRFVMNVVKDGSTLANAASGNIGGSAVRKALIDQWLSDPLAAQTITGTFTGQVQYLISSITSTTGQGFLYLRVINSDGTIATEVGTCTTSNLTTTLTNRTLIALNVGTLNITAGQRICIDLGWNESVGSTTTRTASISEGSSSGTDLPVDNIATTVNNPWVQFSQTLVFQSPANDACGNAVTLTPGATCSPTTGNLQYATSVAPAGACGGATAATTYDVWYKFVATSSTQAITVNNLGSKLAAATTYIETFSGGCGALVSLGCQAATTRQVFTGLVAGTTYYTRVYVTGNPLASATSQWNFDICVQGPPANDDCAGAISLTPGASCVNTAGTLDLSTANALTPVGCFAAGTYYDVWYSFVATTMVSTVTISSPGANIAAPRIQIYSGTCGALSSMGCVSGTSLTQPGLTIGNTYYVRIANFTTNPSGTGGVAGFNICVVANAPVNDACANATTLTPGNICTNTTSNIQYANVPTGTGAAAGACGGATLPTTYDVWFKFVATNTTQAITLSSLGTNLAAATTYIETLSGACGSLTSLGCQNASTRQVINSLTIGNTYYIRVYVTTAPTNATTANWNFNICITGSVNDESTGAISLTPGSSCVNTAGTLDLATANGANPLGCFAAGTYYDVWYSFVATTTIETITLSSLGANFTAPRIQIYSGTPGSLVSFSCASASTLTEYGLTVGATYYVRIANFNANPTGAGTVANFNICITYMTPVVNDDCTGAITLTSGTTCVNTAGNMIISSPTRGLPSCGNSGSSDIWFKFIAQSNRPVITLSTLGVNMASASPFIQLFSGSCGSLTQLACTTSPLNTAVTPGGVGLSLNSTYYIRITTNTNTGILTSGTYTFNICITDPTTAVVDYAKSYVNISDVTGGTINPGDVLEIRSILVVQRPTGSAASVAIDSVAFYDTLRAGRGFALLHDSMALKTNEGKLFRPTTSTYFTDTHDVADAAWITTSGAGADTTLQINMGTGSTWNKRGKITHTSKPSNFGSTCIIMATYRVRVNGAYGTTIKYGGGGFRYRDSATATFYTITFPSDSLVVYNSPGSCLDATSPTNVVSDEYNGTFGTTSGAPIFDPNRGTSPNTNYAYATFAAGNGPGDYYYGVTSNTSGDGTNVQTVIKPSGNTKRVFGVWDITGDHTGASNTAKGNPPCNINLPVSASNPCGYMLVVNTAYRTDVAFETTFTGACSETYYEISAWIKNICYKCGCDSNGIGLPMGAGYIPTGAGDSSGVKPNLAIQINGIDYYTTGDIAYQGLGGTQTGSDTLNKWVKRSFVYKTKPGENSFDISFRNNAPGGGGNDWAIDDIGIRTCYPSMSYSPSIVPTVCAGQTITIGDTVRSYYSTYIYYKWQVTTDGVTWTDIAGTSGTATPTLVSGFYQFVTSYTLPPSMSTLVNNGDQYRVVVATNTSNLASGCNYTDATPITITVNNCIDIDDDNDGIPDYVEFDNPLSLQDADGDGIPNWKDTDYPGYVDTNSDGVNDNFDWGADSDNDGIPNYKETGFWTGWTDVNGDGINDKSDKDLDGIPNQYDRDSDNDGIPDVVESYGVDANGDGIIDNYTDTDNDGFSQNVDGNNTGVSGSGNGLGAQDFDGDGIPNYLDLDSDNDGIPDAIEVGATDANNDGKADNYADANADGFSDIYFTTSALLKTSTDGNGDGRADSWPNKNKDQDAKPNPYDLDSDGDGIVDVVEAGLTDANFDGIVDGGIGSNGWSTTVSAMGSLTLRNSDGDIYPDYLDIDSDNDGIPDNIEGQTTSGYITPTVADTDGDGLANVYDNLGTYGGMGIAPLDLDADGTPDYRDTDTDADGQLDIVEGNDFNLDGIPNDLVTLTGLDTDGDGLDNRFDSLNSTTVLKGTSYMMGNGGSFVGDPAPGSRCTVQRKFAWQTDRDWRFSGIILPAKLLQLSGTNQNSNVSLSWTVIAAKEIDHFEIERSFDNSSYTKVGTVVQTVKLNEQQVFAFTDDINNLNKEIIFYRIKVIGKTGEIQYSNVISIKVVQFKTDVTMAPNPANGYVTLTLHSSTKTQATITIFDKVGSKVLSLQQGLKEGFNNVTIDLAKFNGGVYAITIETAFEKVTKQLMIIKN